MHIKFFNSNKPILIAGCSHTWGSGHFRLFYGTEEDPYSKEPAPTTWPYFVFDKKDINNIAWPGASNEDITNSVMTHINSNTKVLFVMFTHNVRKKFFYNNKSFTYSPQGIHSVSNNRLEDRISYDYIKNDKNLDLIHKSYTLQQNTDTDYYQSLKQIHYLQLLCESFKIKFYWTAIENFLNIQSRDKFLQWQIDQIKKKINFECAIFPEGLGFDDRSGNLESQLPCGHYNLQYHARFGDQIKHIINT